MAPGEDNPLRLGLSNFGRSGDQQLGVDPIAGHRGLLASSKGLLQLVAGAGDVVGY